MALQSLEQSIERKPLGEARRYIYLPVLSVISRVMTGLIRDFVFYDEEGSMET